MLPSEFKGYTKDRHPLVIDTEEVKKIGLNESIVIRHIHNRLTANEKTGHNTVDNAVWCYNTVSGWTENNFSFWSYETVKRTIASLRRKGLLVVRKNPHDKWDNTNWYTINYEKYSELFEEDKKVKQAEETRKIRWKLK